MEAELVQELKTRSLDIDPEVLLFVSVTQLSCNPSARMPEFQLRIL